ncbi:MAG: DUF2784 domain-containing protein [Deltaproteobacteria bacterium]|nr:DUF2784 domain-containing protein [Deltaproteobacteria bacterium]
MFFLMAADFLVILHLLFIIFVVLGGWLVRKWRWLIYLHIPAAAWGALIEFQGWVCPLTPLEQQLRRAGGQSPYRSTFIEHYVLPVIYPEGLTRDMQISFGFAVIIINLAAYGFIAGRKKRGE